MINHKTSDQFRREVKNTSFINYHNPHEAQARIQDYMISIIDAYEACEQERRKYRQDLEQIANADYRGNRSPESIVAFKSINE